MNHKTAIIIAAALLIAAAAEAAELPESTHSIVVKPRDTLSRLAWEHLGDASQYGRILELNDDIVDPNLIYVGQVLVLPGAGSSLPPADVWRPSVLLEEEPPPDASTEDLHDGSEETPYVSFNVPEFTVADLHAIDDPEMRRYALDLQEGCASFTPNHAYVWARTVMITDRPGRALNRLMLDDCSKAWSPEAPIQPLGPGGLIFVAPTETVETPAPEPFGLAGIRQAP